MKISIDTLVEKQVAMLNEGKVLEALDEFYAEDCKMYHNDTLFSNTKQGSKEKQEPFIKPCTSIEGNISKHFIKDGNISVLHNETSFTHPQHGDNKINGIHVQHWEEGLIVKEYYYQDEMLEEKLREWFGK